MSKKGLLNILEGVLDLLKRAILFLPELIGVIKTKETQVKDDAGPSNKR